MLDRFKSFFVKLVYILFFLHLHILNLNYPNMKNINFNTKLPDLPELEEKLDCVEAFEEKYVTLFPGVY